MRRRLAAGLGLGLGLAHACSGDGFVCESDEQCTLAGAPGSCVAGGHCAYPEPDCASGLAYPQGARDGLAGECVPDEATGSASEGQTDDTAPTASSDDEPPADTSGSDADGSSGGALACGDPYEPNDGQAQASEIALAPRGCQANWDAFIEDPVDADWFLLTTTDMACSLSAELTFVTTPPLELCAVPECSDGVEPTIAACDGNIVPFATGPACCSPEQLRVTAACGDMPPTMRLGVAAADAPACLPYQAAAYL